MKRFVPFPLLVAALTTCATDPGVTPPRVHFGNGIKIGDVRADSALVWVRLTRASEPNAAGVPFERAPANAAQLPPGLQLAEMCGAVPGAAGDVRVHYRADAADADTHTTPWQTVDVDRDFTRTFRLDGLAAGCAYTLSIEGRAGADDTAPCRLDGSFRTAPNAEDAAPASFCVATCQDWHLRDAGELGHRVYATMLAADPDFLVFAGDTVYYDRPEPCATSVELARFKWNRLYGLPLERAFHRRVATWFMKDDHDTLKDDCWPGQRYGALDWNQGLAIFREQTPIEHVSYRHVRWGRDLELWFIEGREFRSPNRIPDGPDKTILGEEQKRWLRETMAASDATWRVLVSPTPIVGPDRQNKNDNLANAGFAHEGDELRRFLGGLPNTIVICGDRHWQYVSRDPVTGLREFSCGPTSDAHAGGFRAADRSAMHEYLKVCGGFLDVHVAPDRDGARLQLRHRAVDGTVLHEVELVPERSR